MTAASNADQIKYWNDVAGPTWARLHAQTEAQLEGFGRAAMERAGVAPGERVLDVGCGAGATSVELGRRVGPTGQVLGLDVSGPLLDLARQAASGLPHVSFELADAAAAELPEGAFDLLFSRFGIMFFADPPAAFAHLRRALRPGGRLCVVCWRAVEHNPWIGVPMQAIAPHVAVAPSDPDAPGPLAFAGEARVRRILDAAGFLDVTLEAHDGPMGIGAAPTVDEVMEFMNEVGPAARALREAPEDAAARGRAALREALVAHAGPEGVALGGGVWIVRARCP